MSVKFSSIPQKRLLQGITSAASSFYLNNIVSFDGLTDVVPGDLGTQHYCAFRNDTGTILELMEIDPATISAGPITILRRGLSFYGDRTTETAALKLDWPTNTIVMLGTDVPQLFQYLKEYIDAASIAGAVPASTSAAGIVVEASQTEVDARTATKVVGADTYKLFAPLDKIRATKYHDYVADAGANDTYTVTITPAPTAYAAGQEFTFKANTANTGACTLNVNSLGAKTIKKYVNTDLETGDILAGQIVKVMYDGTNMVVLSDLAPASNVQTFIASGTWTKPPKGNIAFVQVWGAGGSGAKDTVRAAGSGGGGGYMEAFIPLSSLSATETITIGAGGASVSSNGGGNAGGNSSFGSWLVAYGGGAGGYDAANAGGGGGGGGSSAVGANATSSGGAGGGILGGAAGNPGADSIYGGGGGGNGGTNANGGSSVYGGGGGAGGTSTTGGNSIYGGAGGGGGTSLFGGNGGADGATGTDGSVGGGGGGASSSGNSGAGGGGRIIVTVY